MAREKSESRWWSGHLSKFGKYLRDHKLTREVVAAGADVTPSYISMIAHGKASPGLKLAIRISGWTAKNVKGADGKPAPFTLEEWA